MMRLLFTGLVAAILAPAALAVSQVTLAWDQSTSPNVTSQVLYYSNTPVNPGTGRFNAPASILLGLVNSRLVGNLAPGTYYFAVTAKDSGSLESVYSNIVSVVLPIPSPTPSPSPTPPTPPTNLHLLP